MALAFWGSLNSNCVEKGSTTPIQQERYPFWLSPVTMLQCLPAQSMYKHHFSLPTEVKLCAGLPNSQLSTLPAQHGSMVYAYPHTWPNVQATCYLQHHSMQHMETMSHPSFLLQLLQQSLSGVDGGVQQGVRLLPHPIQVKAPQIAPVVANSHPIWVQHGYHLQAQHMLQVPATL